MAFGIPNIERVVSNFLESGTGITAIRSVEYDKNYLWAVDFVQANNSITPPQPFDAFFPASDVTLNLASVVSEQQNQNQTQFSFPKGGKALDLSVTFYDDQARTLQQWFKDWMVLDIQNNGEFMSGLGDSHAAVAVDSFQERRRVYPVRQLRLALLDSYKNDAKIYDYMVYPDADLNLALSQGSQATQFTVNFIIVEDLTANRKAGVAGGFSFDDVKGFLGRFI